MATMKKDFGLIVWAFGWLLSLATSIKKLAGNLHVPFEAFERLGTDQGETTLAKMLEIVRADWQAEQPQPPEFVESAGGHAYRDAPANGVKVVAVPDLSPAELVVQAEKKIGFTYLNPSFKTWNFCQYHVAEGQPARFLDVRGQRYEVLTWKPGKYVTTQQVRDYFKDLGADGNTAAFISWISETKPAGYHVSIPSDDDLLYRGSDSRPCAPYFRCDDARRELYLRFVSFDWDGLFVCVAFRAISS